MNSKKGLQKVLNFSQKIKFKKEILIFLVIFIVGVFFRTYHFSDLLLFEIDQTYDTRIVSEAVENGISNLPLLGPTAGGGRALRLGPAFYYMEFVSAKVFGNTPTGHAMLVLLFSIAAIPLFYLFCRKYFDKTISLLLLSIFSTSVFLVLYGRFSWSPNVLPFLILLSFYALLRSVEKTESRPGRWFLLSVAAITITSQIHFNAFFTIPTIAVIFLLYKKPKFSLKTWLASLGIILVIYSPMIFSDISTGGENINFFIKKISKGGSSSKGIVRKAIVDLQYNASGYFFVNSGIDHINGIRVQDYGFQNDVNLPWRVLAIILFVVQIAILLNNIKKEKDAARKDFLILAALWVTIPFAYFFSLISNNFHFYPRFYLLIAPVAIILLGILLEKIQFGKESRRKIVLSVIVLLFLIPNVTRIFSHFKQLSDPTSNKVEAEREDIFPNDKRLTLKEQLEVVQYITSKQKENGYPVYINTYNEYEPVFWYHLSKNGVPFSDEINSDHLYSKANYFEISQKTSGTRSIEESFEIKEKKRFGVLVVFELSPRPEKIKEEIQNFNKPKQLLQTTQILELKTWKNIFNKK